MKSNFLTIFILCSVFICRAQTTTTPPDIIPIPNQVEMSPGAFTFSPETLIATLKYTDLADYLNNHFKTAWGIELQKITDTLAMDAIVLQQIPGIPEEGYTLAISQARITISASDRGGIFNGIQTLLQLFPPEIYSTTLADAGMQSIQLPNLFIEDAPRFSYRGVMLDVSRTFFDKETVKQYLDWASHHKINKLHWHLTDDNGWRIEIKKYPLLTEKGAWRGPGEALYPSYGSGQKRYGGYYTQDDIREIVNYAAFRNIEIIPEIELPGHSSAVTAAYPETFCDITTSEFSMRDVWCTGREENFAMLRDILTEIAALFPSKYIHIGGDEVSFRHWRECPRCQARMKAENIQKVENLQNYFMGRLEEILQDLDKYPAAWNEAAKGGTLSKNTLISGWQNIEENENTIKAGYPIVMMPGSYMYIDMKQSPYERGHTWAGMVDLRRLYSFDPALAKIPAGKEHLIHGVEAAQFGELMDRPERFLEYQGYPRLCALAEVGWSNRGRRDWTSFYRCLTEKHLARLEAMGIQFRMFPPEVTYSKGLITAKPSLQRVEIRYTEDLSEPDRNSRLYEGPVRTDNPERFLFRAFYRGGYSPAVPPVVARVEKAVLSKGTASVHLSLPEYVSKSGLWLLTVIPEEENLTIRQLNVSDIGTPYTVIRNGQRANPFGTLRLYLTDNRRTGNLNVILANNAEWDNKAVIELRPSPYTEPKVSIRSSLTARSNFPFMNISDYNFLSYARMTDPCKVGDYVTYTFEEPVACEMIDIRTGIPNITRYIVTQGDVEYSTDGTTFEKIATLDDNGGAVIRPAGKVKAVRIAIKGNNGEPTVAFQDLRIVPKY